MVYKATLKRYDSEEVVAVKTIKSEYIFDKMHNYCTPKYYKHVDIKILMFT